MKIITHDIDRKYAEIIQAMFDEERDRMYKAAVDYQADLIIYGQPRYHDYWPYLAYYRIQDWYYNHGQGD
jgi:hypothetical protein